MQKGTYCGDKATYFTLGNITVYYSYQTVIAFRDEHGLTISDNIWSNTTGKHLNAIHPDKSIRIKYDEFTKKYNEMLKAHKLDGI